MPHNYTSLVFSHVHFVAFPLDIHDVCVFVFTAVFSVNLPFKSSVMNKQNVNWLITFSKMEVVIELMTIKYIHK